MFFYENKYFDIPINCQLDLFDKVINQILPQTVYYMDYGETGSLYPLSLFVKIRIWLCTGRKKTDECTLCSCNSIDDEFHYFFNDRKSSNSRDIVKKTTLSSSMN